MAAVKRKQRQSRPKKPAISREELAKQKELLSQELESAYGKVKAFCTGRPPAKVMSGSYQSAIAYKDLVSKARALNFITRGSVAVLTNRIARFNNYLVEFQKFT